MKTKLEIENMLKHSINKDGLISPAAIITLKWVLGLKSDDEYRSQFKLRGDLK